MIGAQPLDVQKLAKLLGLLGSDHDGEIAAAGRAADRLVRNAGMRWPDVLRPALPPPPERVFGSADDPVEYCLEYDDLLTEWELKFLRSLRRQRRPLSDKQAAVVGQILAKVQAEVRAAA